MGITMEVYRLQGDAVLPYLKELRKKQMEEYQEGFAEIDKELGRTSSVNIHDNTPISPAQSYKSTSPEKRPRKKKDASKQDIYAEDEYTRSPLKNNKQQDDLDIDTSPQQHEHEEEQQHDDDEEVDELAEETFDEPFTCQFCGRHDPSFTDMKLDVHYWRECPMLCGCPRCEQIIEVSTLNDHLLNECTKKDNHKMCPRCGEAIAARYYELHVKRNNCLECKSKDEANRCPLCHKVIPPGENGWKQHLLTGKGCPKNKRPHFFFLKKKKKKKKKK